jgi:hypothetical protein
MAYDPNRVFNNALIPGTDRRWEDQHDAAAWERLFELCPQTTKVAGGDFLILDSFQHGGQSAVEEVQGLAQRFRLPLDAPRPIQLAPKAGELEPFPQTAFGMPPESAKRVLGMRVHLVEETLRKAGAEMIIETPRSQGGNSLDRLIESQRDSLRGVPRPPEQTHLCIDPGRCDKKQLATILTGLQAAGFDVNPEKPAIRHDPVAERDYVALGPLNMDRMMALSQATGKNVPRREINDAPASKPEPKQTVAPQKRGLFSKLGFGG